MNQMHEKYRQTQDGYRPGNRDNRKSRNDSLLNIEPKPLPEDFVDEAERVMRSLMGLDSSEPITQKFNLTTSKLRNILSLVTDIYNSEINRADEKLTHESMRKIQMMRVRIVYEVGRDDKEENVKPFVEKSNVLSYIKDIGDSRKKFIDFAQYMEALVAYHRFLGGRD